MVAHMHVCACICACMWVNLVCERGNWCVCVCVWWMGWLACVCVWGWHGCNNRNIGHGCCGAGVAISAIEILIVICRILLPSSVFKYFHVSPNQF